MHVRPLALVLAAIALATAACGSDGGSGEARETTRNAAEAAATQTGTTAEQVSVEERPATDAEVRWVGRLETWLLTIIEPVETASSGAMALAEGKRLERNALAVVEDALNSIAVCSQTYERTAGDAPSARLEDVAGLVRDACRSFEEGAQAGLRAVRDEVDTDALEEWGRHWETGGRLVQSARDVFADYSPANQKKLKVVKGMTTASRQEPTFSSAAEYVVQGESDRGSLEVRCWSDRDWAAVLRDMNAYASGRFPIETTLGFTGVGDYRVNLAPEVCEALAMLFYERARPADGDAKIALALSVGTLAHEAQHARGVVNEAAAECYGMQYVRRLARGLRVEPAYANELAALYWQEVYPRNAAAYRSRECRNGGALDAFPKTSVWP